VLVKSLISHLLVARNEVVMLDMEAGIEHLGRATVSSVDKLIVVVEPGRNSIDTAQRIDRLAKDIGLSKIGVVGNKVRSGKDSEFIMESLPGFEFLGFIPYEQGIVDADIRSIAVVDSSKQALEEAEKIFKKLIPA
jgi:CO dehydrogenase maturation factor